MIKRTNEYSARPEGVEKEWASHLSPAKLSSVLPEDERVTSIALSCLNPHNVYA